MSLLANLSLLASGLTFCGLPTLNWCLLYYMFSLFLYLLKLHYEEDISFALVYILHSLFLKWNHDDLFPLLKHNLSLLFILYYFVKGKLSHFLYPYNIIPVTLWIFLTSWSHRISSISPVIYSIISLYLLITLRDLACFLGKWLIL